MPGSSSGDKTPSLSSRHKWILGGVVILLVLWITFFDSHSVVKRIRWHFELQELKAENTHLKAEIDSLNRQLDRLDSDSIIERIAREEYGMHRPGEKVFHIKSEP